ncbi:protein of unknown function DUF763 [Ammonifex degensii KC4]|uniref:DUF763 domain-containing protein n=1 Tax=Ammonifex degensii (strain DSM 10501 / KC4) TaxID=429009 RepID=C9RD53_AMMDK|nr:DUF763 domain-containing protein [Ammonifex degensii]ACX52180.1 protein of unknown function DUF763 [Ammonifex degensii KC4]
MRTGITNLPLHHGRCPPWLFEKMVELARAIVELLVLEEGAEGVLRRLSDPFWFQSLGCVLGFDWHSSGVTTTVCGALKEALRHREGELGLFVCGGKGTAGFKTPEEICRHAERYSLKVDPEKLVRASRLAAKIDQSALQDGYELYHHTFFFTSSGEWAVVQQGMNTERREARRYHWLSFACPDFAEEPHAAICSERREEFVLNLVARESRTARDLLPEIAREQPEKLVKWLSGLKEKVLDLPRRHQLWLSDLNPRRLKTVFLHTYERLPADFLSLLETPGIGAQGLRALSLIAELVYGTPLSYCDPARFAFAHGGKDGHPYPVDRVTMVHSIQVLSRAVERAKLGINDKREALRRLAHIFPDLP